MPLGVLKDIRKIYAGLNAGGIREAAAQPLRIRLVATSEDVYRDMEDFLVPPSANGTARGQALGMIVRLDEPQKDFDILLCEAGVVGYRVMAIYSTPAEAMELSSTPSLRRIRRSNLRWRDRSLCFAIPLRIELSRVSPRKMPCWRW